MRQQETKRRAGIKSLAKLLTCANPNRKYRPISIGTTKRRFVWFPRWKFATSGLSWSERRSWKHLTWIREKRNTAQWKRRSSPYSMKQKKPRRTSKSELSVVSLVRYRTSNFRWASSQAALPAFFQSWSRAAPTSQARVILERKAAIPITLLPSPLWWDGCSPT